MKDESKVRIALTQYEWSEVGWNIARHMRPEIRRGTMEKLITFIEIIAQTEGYNKEAYDCRTCGTVSTFIPHFKECPEKENN